MDTMELSLDDIIKKHKKPKTLKKQKTQASGKNKILKVLKKPKILDARSKIIQKNRSKIVDARTKLSVKDARSRISAKQPNISEVRRGNFSIKRSGKGIISLSTSRAGKSKRPPRIRNNDDYNEDEDEDDDFYEAEMETLRKLPPLKRTVQNDLAFVEPSFPMPPLPNFNSHVQQREDDHYLSDPFDCYIVPTRRNVTVPKVPQRSMEENFYPPPRFMEGAKMDSYENGSQYRNILSHPSNFERSERPERRRETHGASTRYSEYPTQISDNMRSRLTNNQRNPNESMGIFAKTMDMAPIHRPKSPPAQQIGYRIIVSNLHRSVTEIDVKELFEDIGNLVGYKLIRTGVAEVVFRLLKEAEEAVKVYHNRMLDGKPMNCLLVQPRSSNKPTAPAISSYNRNARGERESYNQDVDMDDVYKVLFRR